jgi:hypothetical protein
MWRREFIAGLGALAGEAVCQSNPIFAQTISGIAHRTVQANGINLHFAEMGEGPLVVLRRCSWWCSSTLCRSSRRPAASGDL